MGYSLSLELKLNLHFFKSIASVIDAEKLMVINALFLLLQGKILNWRRGMLNSMLNYEAF